MKVKKQVAEIVNQDLKEAALWYNRARSGLGKVFLKEVKAEVNQIVKNPLAYEVRYANIRIAFVKKFPYGIHFEYHERKASNYISCFPYLKKSRYLGEKII